VQDDVATASKVDPDVETRYGDNVQRHHRHRIINDYSTQPPIRHRRHRLRGPRADPLCVFHERHSLDGFTELQSAFNRSGYVAFGRSGLGRRVVVSEDDDDMQVDRPTDSGSTQSSQIDSRWSRQFVKTDFAYVGESSGETNATPRGDAGSDSFVGNRRAEDRGSGGSSSHRRHQQQQQQQSKSDARHDYHGPAIDYRRVYAKLRSTTSVPDSPSSSSTSSSQLKRRHRNQSSRTTPKT